MIDLCTLPRSLHIPTFPKSRLALVNVVTPNLDPGHRSSIQWFRISEPTPFFNDFSRSVREERDDDRRILKIPQPVYQIFGIQKKLID